MIHRARGWKYCTFCERPKPLSDFYRGGKGGINGRCKRCQAFRSRLWMRRWYQTHKRLARQRRRESHRALKARRAAAAA